MILGGKVTYSLLIILGAEDRDTEDNMIECKPPVEGLCCTLPPFGQRWAQETMERLRGCNQSEMKQHFFASSKLHSLCAIRNISCPHRIERGHWDNALNPTFDPWQVATLHGTLLTTYLFRRSHPSLSQGSKQWKGCSLWRMTSQAFHRSIGKLCLKWPYICLNRHDPYSWDTFFTVMSVLEPESRQWFIWVFHILSFITRRTLGHL